MLLVTVQGPKHSEAVPDPISLETGFYNIIANPR